MNRENAVQPLQMRLKEICISVEKRFMAKDGRRTFCIKFTPAAAILATALLCGAIPAAVSAVLTVAAGFIAAQSAVRRLRDLGEPAAKVLHIAVPIFVCMWIGPKIPDGAWLREAFCALLCFWPAVLTIRLYCCPGRSVSL